MFVETEVSKVDNLLIIALGAHLDIPRGDLQRNRARRKFNITAPACDDTNITIFWGVTTAGF